MLERGPDSAQLPLWTKLRAFARFSKRARWASLRRTSDLTTPPPNVEDANQDTNDNQQRRRRRALITILRALSTDEEAATVEGKPRGRLPAIAILDRKSRMEQQSKRKNNDEGLTKRRPDELESPHFTVLDKKSNTFEIRRYECFAVCSVAMNKPRPKDSSRTVEAVSGSKKRWCPSLWGIGGILVW